jgi:hypothetical protein
VVAEGLVDLTTAVSTTFVVAEDFAETASLVATAGIHTSTDLISVSGPTGVHTPIGTDMAQGGDPTPIPILTGLTIPTTILTIPMTVHDMTVRDIAVLGMIAMIAGMIEMIATIAAIRTIAIRTMAAPTVPRTPPDQTGRTLPRDLQIRLTPKALRFRIT